MFHPITISNKWNKILSQTKITSSLSNMNIQLGSVLLYNGRIVNRGCNRNDRTRFCNTSTPGVHAEMNSSKILCKSRWREKGNYTFKSLRYRSLPMGC